MDFKKRYKIPPSTFGIARIKENLTREQLEERKKRRMQNFGQNRKEKIPSLSTPPPNDERKKKLLEWQAERDKKKKAEDLKKKPVFKVGVVHHSACSPLTITPSLSAENTKKKNITHNTQEYAKGSFKKGITKVTEKRLLAKSENVTKQKLPSTSIAQKSLMNEKSKSDVDKRKSFAPLDHKFNPPSGLPKVSLFGGVFIEHSPCKNANISCVKLMNINNTDNNKNVHNKSDSIESVTLQLSLDEQDVLNTSREKLITFRDKSTMDNNNVSAEFSFIAESENFEENLMHFSSDSIVSSSFHLKNIKDDLNGVDKANFCQPLFSNKIPLNDAKIEIRDISAEKEYTSQYFKYLLNKERNRLQELCDKWMEIQVKDDTTEDAQHQINQAVGQTTLLINEKFKQFHGLILNCEKGEGNLLVTCIDLHGFWDMMYLEIKNCNSRFEKLEKFRLRHWREEEPFFMKSIIKKKIIVKKKVTSTKQSSLQALILANRRKLRKKGTDLEEGRFMKNPARIMNIDNKCITSFTSNKIAQIITENNSDSIYGERFSRRYNSAVYTSTPITNIRHCCKTRSKHMQTSNSCNQLATPLIAMKLSQLYNKSSIQPNDATLFLTADQMPEKATLLEKESAKINSTAQKDTNEHHTLTKLFDEDFNAFETLHISSDKENDCHVNRFSSKNKISIEERSKSLNGSSVAESFETVIETTIKPENNSDKIRSSFRNINSFKTPVRNNLSSIGFQESLSCKKLRIGSLKNLKDQVIKRNRISSSTSPTIDLSISQNTSLNDDIKNVTPRMRLEFDLSNIFVISDSANTVDKQDSSIKLFRKRIINYTSKPIENNKMIRLSKEKTDQERSESSIKMERNNSVKDIQNSSKISIDENINNNT